MKESHIRDAEYTDANKEIQNPTNECCLSLSAMSVTISV